MGRKIVSRLLYSDVHNYPAFRVVIPEAAAVNVPACFLANSVPKGTQEQSQEIHIAIFVPAFTISYHPAL